MHRLSGFTYHDGMIFNWFRNRRRRQLLQEPWPADWQQILDNNISHLRHLPPELVADLKKITRILVVEKIWEGCAGLHVTEEIKVTISAQAAIPLLRITHDYFERVPSILVYPKPFVTTRPDDNADQDFVPDKAAEGQAVYRGPVILAWDEVLHDGRHPEEGENVVIHEFAHQLDYLDNSVDGIPPLESMDARRQWKHVMQETLQQLRHQFDHHRKPLLFAHAASENLTELFAYASELYFCRPDLLSQNYPKVYDLLKKYYRVETVSWFKQ